MIRNLVIVILSLALLGCLYAGTYRWITADTVHAMRADRPELEWLRHEYQLTDEQYTEVRVRHEAYDPKCRELCRDLVAAQNKLQAAIAEYPDMSSEVRDALAAWTEQRKRCREATVAHMYEISALMDDEAAARYRKRIFRDLIVPSRMPHVGEDGEFHEKLIEHRSGGDGSSESVR